jgi:outer membrane protein, heavy metal efflux system
VEQADQGDFMAVRFRGSLLVLALVTAGCQTEPTVAHFVTRDAGPASTPQAAAPTPAQQTSAQQTLAPHRIVPAVHEELPATAPPSSANNDKIDPLLSGNELSVEGLLAAVEERNPSLAAMVAAWQAAAQRYPQAVALDDPMLQFMLAPASLGSSQVEPAYAIQASQKLPWYGKRDARGQAATAEANAAYFDAEESRLRLREATRLIFLEYYLVQRNLDLNRDDVRVMQELRRTAVTKYQANQVTQQDVLQADVELADLERRRLELDRMQSVAIARINTLLGRRPDVPLPPAPRQLAPVGAVPPAEQLEQSALAARPDLAALQARVESEQAAVTLACKQADPDVEIFGRYDTFWQPSSQADLRGQIGVSLNLPVYHGKLNAAANEAMFRLNQRKAEYEQRVLDIQYEIRSASERLTESQKTVRLYALRILPAAEQNVAVARSNYDVGKTTFLGLAQAQRQLIELREKQQDAVFEEHRRFAELERTLGGSPANKPPGP